MKHGLTGGLAGLGVLLHGVHAPRHYACVAHCREGLSLAPDLCESSYTTINYARAYM